MFKLAIFIAVFFASVKLKDRLLPKTFETRFSIFNHHQEEAHGILPFLQKQLYFDNVKEFMVLLFRILLSRMESHIILNGYPSLLDVFKCIPCDKQAWTQKMVDDCKATTHRSPIVFTRIQNHPPFFALTALCDTVHI